MDCVVVAMCVEQEEDSSMSFSFCFCASKMWFRAIGEISLKIGVDCGKWSSMIIYALTCLIRYPLPELFSSALTRSQVACKVDCLLSRCTSLLE